MGDRSLRLEEILSDGADVEESFMDREIYDFKNRGPKPRTSHITEDDEAYNVLKELDEQKNNSDDIE